MQQHAFADRYEWRAHFGPHVGKEDFEVRFQAGELVVLGAKDPTLVDDVLTFPQDALRGTLDATFKEQNLIISASRVQSPGTTKTTSAQAAATDSPSTSSRQSPPKQLAAAERAPAVESARMPAVKLPKSAGPADAAPQAAGPLVHKITNYAFADDGALVKVYVPWPGAHALKGEQVTLQVGDDGGHLECRVATGPESTSCLGLLLYDRVSTTATVKIKSDKLVLILAKAGNTSRGWLSLTRKPWEFLSPPTPPPDLVHGDAG
jgi:uncharacterized membrane protein